ncbi:unnamed protein product [Cylindrotheca closterium]|uniref:Uncharacterized protein n=1 Tax=Cylindrotheca closterium TaxID=2856 RepID=A0AAD2FL15_9STRA|nr:unnamed protein product [Cylindrotheca closterium]
MDFNASTGDFNASAVFFDSDGEDEKEDIYFDASPSANPKVKSLRPDMGKRTDSSGALEQLMSEQPVPKSPGKNGAGTRRSRERRLQDNASSWDKLKKRMKSPGRLGSPRRVSSPTRMQNLDTGESLVSSSDHALYAGSRRRSGGSLSTSMAGGIRSRASRAASSHGGGRQSTTLDEIASESPRQRSAASPHGAGTGSGSGSPPLDNIASESPITRRRARKKKESMESDDSSVISSRSTLSTKSAGALSKSPRTRSKKVKNAVVEDSPSVSSEKTPRNRLRRKGARKNEFYTPNPRSKPMVELNDLARLTDVYHDAVVNTKSKTKNTRQSSADSSTDIKLSDGEVSLTPSIPALPFDDDDDDDDGATITSAKTSMSGKSSGDKKKKKKRASGDRVSSKSPGRLKRSAKVDVSGFENDIAVLQEEVLRLKESKITADSETSKHMQELRRKAFDARLELQKSQLENRQVRSDLRDQTTALNEAELDIEALEKRLNERENEIEQLRRKLKEQSMNGDGNGSSRSGDTDITPPPPPPQPATPKTPSSSAKSQQAIIDRYEAIINRKDSKVANLERELRRLRKSGGGVLQSEQNEMQETIADLQRALKESQAKTIAISNKFSGQKDQYAALEEEVHHWKSQAFGMEDEVAEVRTQLKYWMAKYEDIVGASDTAKAQLASSDKNARDGNKKMLNASYHTQDSGDSDIDDNAPEDRSLWSKIMTPGREKPKLKLDTSQFR